MFWMEFSTGWNAKNIKPIMLTRIIESVFAEPSVTASDGVLPMYLSQKPRPGIKWLWALCRPGQSS
jgi:hypothetical protein